MEKHTERFCRESKCLVFLASSLLLPLSCEDHSICVNPRLGLEAPLPSIPVRVPWAREMDRHQPLLGACHGSLSGSQTSLFFFFLKEVPQTRMKANKQSLAFPSISPTSPLPLAYYTLRHWSSLLLMEHQDPPPPPAPLLARSCPSWLSWHITP